MGLNQFKTSMPIALDALATQEDEEHSQIWIIISFRVFCFLKKEKLDFVVFCFSLRDPTIILVITKHRIFSRGCGIEHLNPALTGKN